MSVLRQLNLLGQQRVDVPHVRMLESSIAADFDVLGGRIIAGSRPLVVRGFTLTNYTAGTPAVSVQLNVADAILMNIGASEAGTFLWVPSNRSAETLDSSINSRVSGGFTASQTNYIGLDLSRKADSDTSDLVQFLDANTLIEQPKTVPLARTLDYKIVISTVPFSAQPNIVPIAKIKTNSSNQVASLSTDVEDARNLAFRLGAGGDFPNRNYSFGWSDGRVEFNTVTGTTVNQFRGGDKIIQSQKDWMDAVMTRIWEIGGGENWYSPVADRNIRMARAPSPSVFASTGDNFEFVSSHLHWQGLSILFENSNGSSVYRNTVADQIGNQTGLTDITAGQCIYVDLDRTATTSLTAQKANLWQLGTPAIPGSRIIIAWCVTTGVIMTRDSQFPVNTALQPATTTVVGGVRLSYAAGTPSTPTVPPLDANNAISIGTGSYPIVGHNNALTVVGGGSGQGLIVTGGTLGIGATINAGSAGSGAALVLNSFNSGVGLTVTAAGGGGIQSTSTGTSTGLNIAGGGSGLLTPGTINAGVLAKGGSTSAPASFATRTNGVGLYGEGGPNGSHGVIGRGASSSTVGSIAANVQNVGGIFVGSGAGEGVIGVSSASNGSSGVYGQGSDGVNARGVVGQGSGTANGVEGTGGSTGTGGHGVKGTGQGTGGFGGDFTGVYGVKGTAVGVFHGVWGKGGSSGVGAGPVGGGFGVYGEGGDFNGAVSFNDTLHIPGANVGGVFVGGGSGVGSGGVGVAGYGEGYPGGANAYGGYFRGATHSSGGSHGIFATGGQGSGSNTSGVGVQGYGGYAPGSAQGGNGGFFWGGFSAGGQGGVGITALGGSPQSLGGSGGTAGTFSAGSTTGGNFDSNGGTGGNGIIVSPSPGGIAGIATAAGRNGGSGGNGVLVNPGHGSAGSDGVGTNQPGGNGGSGGYGIQATGGNGANAGLRTGSGAHGTPGSGGHGVVGTGGNSGTIGLGGNPQGGVGGLFKGGTNSGGSGAPGVLAVGGTRTVPAVFNHGAQAVLGYGSGFFYDGGVAGGQPSIVGVYSTEVGCLGTGNFNHGVEGIIPNNATFGTSAAVFGFNQSPVAGEAPGVYGYSSIGYGVKCESGAQRAPLYVVPSSQPATPTAGSLYVTTGNPAKLMIYTGSAWVVVGTQT